MLDFVDRRARSRSSGCTTATSIATGRCVATPRSHGVGDHEVRLQGRHREEAGHDGRRLRRSGRPARIPLRRHRQPAPPTRGLDVRRSRRAAMAEQEEPDDLEPEVVGTSDPVELQGATVATAVAVNDVSAQFRTTRGGNAEPPPVSTSRSTTSPAPSTRGSATACTSGVPPMSSSPAPSRSSGSRGRSEVGTGSPTRSTSPTSSPPSAMTDVGPGGCRRVVRADRVADRRTAAVAEPRTPAAGDRRKRQHRLPVTATTAARRRLPAIGGAVVLARVRLAAPRVVDRRHRPRRLGRSSCSVWPDQTIAGAAHDHAGHHMASAASASAAEPTCTPARRGY